MYKQRIDGGTVSEVGSKDVGRRRLGHVILGLGHEVVDLAGGDAILRLVILHIVGGGDGGDDGVEQRAEHGPLRVIEEVPRRR